MNWALYNLTSTIKSGGVETTVWNIAHELKERGHHVSVIAGQTSRPLPEVAGELKVMTFPFCPREEYPNLGTRARKFLERLSFARRAIPAISREEYDRLVVFKPYDLAPSLWVGRRNGTKIGYLSCGTEFYPGFGLLAGRLDYLGAISAFNAGQVEKVSGLKVKVNHLGVSREIFRPADPDTELAARLGIEPGDEVLVSAVRLVPLKGQQFALEALARLSAKRPRLKLLVAGEGPYKQYLEGKAKELGLGGRVHFVGFRPPSELASFYALGRAAVFPSQGEEALGLSIAEAMACGLPVVASRLGGIPEVVGEDAGVLVPPKDVDALTGAIDTLLDQPKRQRTMAAEGERRVAELFTWAGCAGRLERGLAGKGY